MSKSKYETREQWLLASVGLMTPLFESAGYKVPKIKVACGWPSSRGLSAKKRCLGEAWSKDAAKDGIAQIFISPWLIELDKPQGVLDTLVHEVVHTVVGNENKHNKVFGKCARAVGLEGKLTATYAGEKLLEACKQWATKLGPYPHAMLDALKRPTKKQTTRMVKCECPECGYVVRTSRKWIDEAGAPWCPQHRKPMTFEIPEELEDDTLEDGDED
jgi:hypothetical protein